MSHPLRQVPLLSTRTRNTLMRSGFLCLEDIARHTEEHMRRLTGFGALASWETRTSLRAIGLDYARNDNE